MRKSSKLIVLLSVLLLAALACSLPLIGGKEEGSSPGDHTRSPGKVEQPTNTPSSGEPEAAQEESPPISFLELLERKTQSGAWTYEEGLIHLLRYAAGEEEDARYDEVHNGELSGILSRAQGYLQTGDDPETKQEIRRLLPTLMPPLEAIQRHSLPRKDIQAQQRVGHLAAPGPQEIETQDCAGLWEKGFPDQLPDGKEEYTCLAHEQVSNEVGVFKVYYPAAWVKNPEKHKGKTDYAPAALAALNKASMKYASVDPDSKGYNISLIFSLNPNPKDATAMGNVDFDHADYNAGEDCPILLYDGVFEITDRSKFQQLVSHEVFHCYQDVNIGVDTTHYQVIEWWVEGSAEYFSNYAYPNPDNEHFYIPEFNKKSLQRPLVKMDYESNLFFQFLESEIGPELIMTLLKRLTDAASYEKQIEALADFPNMDELFHSFAQSFVEEHIADTNSDLINIPDVTFREKIHLSGEDQSFGPENGVDPFILDRYQIIYEQEKRFQQLTIEDTVTPGMQSMRAENESEWRVIPENVRSYCDEDKRYDYVVTRVPGEGEDQPMAPYQPETRVDKVEVGECDPCLLGIWYMDNEVFASYLESSMNEAVAEDGAEGVDFEVQKVEGSLILQFSEKGSMALSSAGLNVPVSASIGGAQAMESEVTVTASGSATYSADGEVVSGSDFVAESEGTGGVDFGQFSTGEVTVHITLPQLIQIGTTFGAEAPDLSETETSYACSEGSLRWMTDQPNPLLFLRSSPEAEE